jgi:hypothetical protein
LFLEYNYKKLLGKKVQYGIPRNLEHGGSIAETDPGKANLFLSKFMGKFHHSYNERILPNCLPYAKATLIQYRFIEKW